MATSQIRLGMRFDSLSAMVSFKDEKQIRIFQVARNLVYQYTGLQRDRIQ